jgi:hypothetical protein
MSSEYNNERLETLQKNYRRAWTTYAAEVECLQSAQLDSAAEPLVASIRERVDQASVGYRVARDEMALFLLDHLAIHPECQAESAAGADSRNVEGREPQLAALRVA